MPSDLDLPPPYTFVRLRERGDAFAHACAIANEAGAGTLVQVGRFDLVEFAVVLEPAEPLAGARRALFAGMSALADALGGILPPEKPLTFVWPGTILYDGALVGGGRLGWPADCPPDGVPDWLVFGAMLRSTSRGEDGLNPGATSLEGEAGEMAPDAAIVAAFARHLMWTFDLWQDRGFPAVADLYLARLAKERAADRCRIAPDGDLVVDNPGVPGEARSPFPAWGAAPWLDPATGTPRLGLLP